MFIINKLICTGKDLKEASIDFDPRTHVIIGPSNTGKSYIFQCIKYLLGSNTPPKRITQSKGYQDCFLEITLENGDVETLKRSLDGGHASLYKCAYGKIDSYLESPIELRVGIKGTKKIGTLGDYLLKVNNLEGIKVRRNLSGVTDDFKYSFLRHLTLIDEASIIKETSPIFSEQNGEATKEKSILRYLITGKDDSKVSSKPKSPVLNNRKGRLEVIELLISDYRSELEDYGVIEPNLLSLETGINDQLGKLNTSIIKNTKRLESLYIYADKFESTLDDNWKEWKENESRFLKVKGLISRSELLNEHYLNDIERLRAVQEASDLLSGLEFGNCPTCHHLLSENEHLDCDKEDIEVINLATTAEIKKIENLINELTYTVSNLVKEKKQLELRIEFCKEKHKKRQDELLSFKAENIKDCITELEILKTKYIEQNHVKKILDKINDLELKKSEYEYEIDPMDGNYTFECLTTSTTTKLCQTIKSILIDWGYSDIETVSFSEKTSDLILNGQDRNLSGKGYRALSFSAFIIGLMHVCFEDKLSHSGIVLLDSPLCTLRSRHIRSSNNSNNSNNSNDVIGDEIKERFYDSISRYKDHGQIIVLDNDGPISPDALEIGFTEFTEDIYNGRYGFYPIKEA